MLCHTALSEALMGIKELSAGLISPLCHPALYCSGRAASAVPDMHWGLCLHIHTHTEIQRLGGATTQRGAHPCAAYLCNKHIHMSLTAKMNCTKIGFKLSKLHALIYLALFADAYVGLQCCFTVHVCHLSLYLQDRPMTRAQVRYQTSNVQIEHMVV